MHVVLGRAHWLTLFGTRWLFLGCIIGCSRHYCYLRFLLDQHFTFVSANQLLIKLGLNWFCNDIFNLHLGWAWIRAISKVDIDTTNCFESWSVLTGWRWLKWRKRRVIVFLFDFLPYQFLHRTLNNAPTASIIGNKTIWLLRWRYRCLRLFLHCKLWRYVACQKINERICLHGWWRWLCFDNGCRWSIILWQIV